MNELELNAAVNWEDADGNKHTGVVVYIMAESELYPARVVLRSYEDKDDLDEVFPHMIESAVNPNGKVIRPNE